MRVLKRKANIGKSFFAGPPLINVYVYLFRIFQESLTNVARHSGASNVIVSLTQENKQLILTVRDNGKGLADRQGNKKHWVCLA